MSGYQGTIYRNTESGDYVVAHRGTEVNSGAKAIIQDALFTDGSMAVSRVNPQAEEAIALTHRAIELAEKEGRRSGHAPHVTVTGHSLGGCHAQITAHHFNLEGETFNAYGAVSLGLRIPEGGHKVVNHVLAGDTVSAASGHYGEVRIYATENDLRAMTMAGYENDASKLDSRMPIFAVGYAAGSHSMHQFTRRDGDERPDRSIFDQPEAVTRAAVAKDMIDKFRDDVMTMRQGITMVGRGHLGAALDGIEALRGPVAPGEYAERESKTWRLPPTPEPTPAHPAPYDSPLFGPGAAFRDIGDYVPKPTEATPVPFRPGGGTRERQAHETEVEPTAPPKPSIHVMSAPGHIAHHLYLQAHSAVNRPGFDPDGLLTEHQRGQLAASHVSASVVAGALHYDSGFRAVDHVVPSTKIDPETGAPRYLIAVQGDVESPASRRAPVDLQAALTIPMEQSSEMARTMLQAREQKEAQALTQAMEQNGPGGPTMRIGGLTIAMPSADSGGGGGDGGGGGGGG
ncbi:MAG: hypothetical protein E6Q50_18190 [Lysobacter sp.]|nr:MAG: hypothetical protein E6Q50_18190 [Lysobacter sp.]